MIKLVINITLIVFAYFQIHSQNTYSFYVSPNGNDNNTGSLNNPFLTIDKARLTIKNHPQKTTCNYIVYLRGGDYFISNTINFSELDGAANSSLTVIYQAYLNEKPIITGGISYIGGWQNVIGKPYYKIAVQQNGFRQLYVNGNRKQRAKTNTKISSLYWTDSLRRGYSIDSNLLPTLYNPINSEVHIQAEWRDYYLPIDSVVSKNTLKGIYSHKLPQSTTPPIFQTPIFIYPFNIENDLNLLDQKGEWYIDNITNTLYYYPEDSINIQTAKITLPVTESFFNIKGSNPLTKVKNLFFKNICFEYAGWKSVNNNGYGHVQAGQLYYPIVTNTFGNQIFAHIYAENTDSLCFEGCEFKHLGALALDLRSGIYRNKISCNLFTDIAEGGVSLSSITHHTINSAIKDSCNYNVISNNVFYKTGQDYFGSVPLIVYYAKGTVIEHNYIADVPYSGISVGWGWSSYLSSQTCSKNIIKYNKIQDYNKICRDGGGIYTLGQQPNSVCSENYILNEGNDYAGLYFDEGTQYYTVRRNVLKNTRNWVFIHQSSIKNIVIDSCFTDTTLYLNNGTNCSITNTIYDQAGNFPSPANIILSNSGPTNLCNNFQNIVPTIIPGTLSINNIQNNYTIQLIDDLILNAIVTDSNNNSNFINYKWGKLSGPGNLTIHNSNTSNVRIAFSLPGVYTLKLMVDNGVYNASHVFTVNITPFNLCGNIAAGKFIKASSSYPAPFLPQKANDGNINSCWSSATSTIDITPYIQINLGNKKTIGRIEIVTRQDINQYSTRRLFGILASNDSTFSSFTPLDGIANDTVVFKGVYTFNIKDTTKYKYIRAIKYIANSDMVIAELKLFSFAVPTISASLQNPVCIGQTVVLNINNVIGTFTWSTGQNTSSITVAPTASSNYSITFTDANACINTYNYNIMVTPCTGIKTPNENYPLRVHPNPTSNTLNIVSQHKNPSKIIIYDLIGRIVVEQDYSNQIDISILTNGIYILHLVNKDLENISSQKIIVQH